jgi:hypothetical protein
VFAGVWARLHDGGAAFTSHASLHRLTRLTARTSPPNALSWWSRALALCQPPFCAERRVRSLALGAAATAAAVARCRSRPSSSSSSSSRGEVCDAVALLLSQHALACSMADKSVAAIKWGAAAAAVAADSVGALHGCIHALKAAAALGWHLLMAKHWHFHHMLRSCCPAQLHSSHASGVANLHSMCAASQASRALLSMHDVVATGTPLADPSALDPHSSLYLSDSAAFQRAAAVLFACSLMISGGTSQPPPHLRAWCSAAAPNLSICVTAECVMSQLSSRSPHRPPPMVSPPSSLPRHPLPPKSSPLIPPPSIFPPHLCSLIPPPSNFPPHLSIPPPSIFPPHLSFLIPPP